MLGSPRPRSSATRPWTYGEYLLLPDGGRRWQIISEWFLTPTPRVSHQRPESGVFAAPAVLATGDGLTTPILPGVELKLVRTLEPGPASPSGPGPTVSGGGR